MYQTQNYDHLLGLNGFSDTLLKNHFTLYAGYVKNTNKLADTLKNMALESKTSSPEFAELKRRFGWEFNGMRLHELYFENLSKEKKNLAENSKLVGQMSENLGSVKARMDLFSNVAAMRGVGWVVLYYDSIGKKIFTQWVNEHNTNHLAGTVPLLVMDMWEHAFMLDYGLNKKEYVEAFIHAIDWEVVEKRFLNAIQ